MTDQTITGGCGCGGVRFAISEPLLVAGYCHCTRCQRRTGTAASISALAPPDALRFEKGAEQVRYWRPADGWAKAFCGSCGSALYSEHPDDPAHRAVRLGTLDGDPGIRPSYRQFVRYAAPWDVIPDDGLPRHAERRPA